MCSIDMQCCETAPQNPRTDAANALPHLTSASDFCLAPPPPAVPGHNAPGPQLHMQDAPQHATVNRVGTVDHRVQHIQCMAPFSSSYLGRSDHDAQQACLERVWDGGNACCACRGGGPVSSLEALPSTTVDCR